MDREEKIQGIVETGIYVDDLDRAAWFYNVVLGLPILAQEAGRHVFFGAGAACVLLAIDARGTSTGEVLPAHGASGPGHFALGVAAGSLTSWRRRLAEHGVAIEKEVSWPRGGHSLYFRDPAGNSVELLTPGVWGLPTGW